MASSPISALKDLNAAILDCNPFMRPAVVSDRNIWGQGFPDLASLNAHASDPVFQAIQQAQTGQPPVASIAIAAPAGFGKSHLIARLRQHFRDRGGTFLIYTNAQKLSDLNLIRYQFLQTLVDSLRQIGSQARMQWQELATLMATQAVQTFKPSTKPFLPRELVKKLDESGRQTNRTWIDQLTDAFLKLRPETRDPDIVRAVFWTLSNAQAPFAIKWIAGRVLAPWKVDELGLPNRSREDREAEAFETIVQLLSLMTTYAPVAICFDQLEAPEVNESNFKRERVVASLVKYLFDRFSLLHLDRGILFLTAMQPETWTQIIQTLPAGIPDRVAGKGKEPIALESPLADERILELVTFRLNAFYRDRNLTPPSPLYPFEDNQLRALGRENLTERDILEWCAENFQPVEVDPLEQVEQAFQAAADRDWSGFLENDTLLAHALYFSFEALTGKTIRNFTIEAVKRNITPKNLNNGYIQFKIIGREGHIPAKVGIAVLQSTQPTTIGAGLKRLRKLETFGLTRSCLLRSRSPQKQIPSHWRAYQELQRFAASGGDWIALEPENISPLLALWSIYHHRADNDLSESHIFEFIVQRQLIANNALIQRILSPILVQPQAEGSTDSSRDRESATMQQQSLDNADRPANSLDSRVR